MKNSKLKSTLLVQYYFKNTLFLFLGEQCGFWVCDPCCSYLAISILFVFSAKELAIGIFKFNTNWGYLQIMFPERDWLIRAINNTKIAASFGN